MYFRVYKLDLNIRLKKKTRLHHYTPVTTSNFFSLKVIFVMVRKTSTEVQGINLKSIQDLHFGEKPTQRYKRQVNP